MGQSYDHLSLEDRCTIARLQAEGRSIRQIAAAVDRSPSTITRELKRNGTKAVYKPGYAQEQSKARRWTGSRLERRAVLRKTVLAGLVRWLAKMVPR
jgi:IS30 family transposase